MRAPPRHVIYAGLVVVAAVAVGTLVTCQPEPEPVETFTRKVSAHTTASVLDSVRVAILRDSIGQAAKAERAAVVVARAAQRSAAAERRRADSLAAEARLAVSLADSARGWQEAYVSRTLEADSLRATVAHLDTALARAREQNLFYIRTDSIHEARHSRADSTIAAGVAAINAAGRCRIIGPIRCPTRNEALVAGLIGGTILRSVIGGGK